MYNENDFRNYELYHHGILGMKWGRRNGPPYPLEAGDHSASEKKAGYKDSIGMRKGSRNEEKYAYTGGQSKTKTSDVKPKDYSTQKARLKKDNSLGKRVKKTIRDKAIEYGNDNSIENEVARKRAEFDNWADNTIDNAKRTKKANTVSGKISESVGVGAKRTEAENKAKYYEKMADTYSNKAKKKEYEAAAQNERYKAEYYDKRAKNYGKGGSSAIKQAGHDFVFKNAEVSNMKYQTVDGRTTTRGEEYIKRVLFDTATGVAMDIAFDKLLRPVATDAAKERMDNTTMDQRIFKNYYDAERYNRRKYLDV